MIYRTFNSTLREVQNTDPELGDYPQLLIYNSGLDAWALLNLNNDNDKVAYFEDPRNVILCMVTTTDVRSLGQEFSLEDACTRFLQYMANDRPSDQQTYFSAFFHKPPDETPPV